MSIVRRLILFSFIIDFKIHKVNNIPHFIFDYYVDLCDIIQI